MMKLRKLEEKDAPLMLEWMHDDSVVHDLGTDFSKKEIGDCEKFISDSVEQLHDVSNANSIHYAIADDTDTYMGTVSLKDIDYIKKRAEFAITIRKSAMGKGISSFGMHEILNYGITGLGLDYIYWCVNEKNLRAIKFYEKMSYPEYKETDPEILDRYKKLTDSGVALRWYRSN